MYNGKMETVEDGLDDRVWFNHEGKEGWHKGHGGNGKWKGVKPLRTNLN